jgi:hypothetical protein
MKKGFAIKPPAKPKVILINPTVNPSPRNIIQFE